MRAQADSHVHQDHDDGDRRRYDTEAADGLERGPEYEGDDVGRVSTAL